MTASFLSMCVSQLLSLALFSVQMRSALARVERALEFRKSLRLLLVHESDMYMYMHMHQRT